MSNSINGKYKYVRIKCLSDFQRKENVFCVFPATYFSPKYPNSFKCPISSHTYCIHHFAASWYPMDKKIFRLIRRLFGYKVAHFCSVVIKKWHK